MNEIVLKGVLQDVEYSHNVGDIQYDKANIVVQNSNGKSSILNLRFKKFANLFKEGDEIQIVGNVRSYSHEVNGKNKVDLYVFTYFNEPEIFMDETTQTIIEPPSNQFKIDGRICSIKELRELNNGKKNIQFILANNIIKDHTKLSNYLPCIAWGKLAKDISELQVNTPVTVYGELRSREYKKFITDTEFEVRVAHELLVTAIEVNE